MKKLAFATALTLAASPALAASSNPFSAYFWTLTNTNLIVLIAFIVFLAVLIYFKVPGMIGKMLDGRADGIRSELDEAKALREEAQTLLASYERKQKDVQEQAARIVESAKEEAARAAKQAKDDIKSSVARRVAAAEDQIASAQQAAVNEVRDSAITVAIGAARDVVAKQLTAADGNKLIDDAIADVAAKLH
ncbi:F0F1 ATP synthase subunit B [Octadecabacter sp. R77987]|uniref:F0F1 ATP synthase subunit B n=1 Tax=Octadecabacter sp. R77987 TaxID=3093874 RepID=UPI00366F7D1E